MKKIVILLGIISIYGCASAPGNDMYSFGQQQALDGYEQLSRLGVKKKTLAKSVSEEEYHNYQEGFDAGLLAFCTKENARNFGQAGHMYHHTCDAIEPDFNAIYTEAYQSE